MSVMKGINGKIIFILSFFWLMVALTPERDCKEMVKSLFDEIVQKDRVTIEGICLLVHASACSFKLTDKNKYYSFFELMVEKDHVVKIRVRKPNESGDVASIMIIFNESCSFSIYDFVEPMSANIDPGFSFIPNQNLIQEARIINRLKVVFTMKKDKFLSSLSVNFNDT